ncbi:sec-independent protein translocase protein TatB [Parvibaculum indicum]|uniref:Sec-independent protein translocase protein TatB n=1 Tax=Parvibaculum indicum TaxID=562969 RepID=UPI00141F6896|nr:Sec-independent protein translocase protein TatB [Parvibaculum indicum]NIJ39837.1 sec-independent protein translocase protein TatB [Parvibaculum indicum]
MFDLGWSELLLIAVIALVVVGPRDLPRMMRTAGQYMAKARKVAREFQATFDELARETEVEELRREVATLKSEATAPLSEMRKDLDKATQPPSSGSNRGAGSAAISETQLDGLPEEMADQIRERQDIERSGEADNGADSGEGEKPASKSPKDGA